MKKTLFATVVASAFVFAATAAAALVPGVFDPGSTGCPTSTFSDGWLHLAKNCPTSTNAAAGAEITGLSGATFSSASFTLKSTTQCQGGSPRFNIITTSATFFLGCNNVTPTTNGDGTATYTFDAATIAAGGKQVPFPTGTIKSAQVLIDVQGTADLRDITVNGVKQVPASTAGHKGGKPDACKNGKWRDRGFRNQGQCVSHDRHAAQKHKHGKHQS